MHMDPELRVPMAEMVLALIPPSKYSKKLLNLNT
jgi:hypothetical protein